MHANRGILGTVELRVRDEAIESPRTTVEAPVLHGLLARMLEEGVTAAVTEVSSHAAALDRISGVDFAVAVFTNLQWDHLDFHHTMEDYLAAKARLFEPGRARRGIINIDDEWGRLLASRVKIPVRDGVHAPRCAARRRLDGHLRGRGARRGGIHVHVPRRRTARSTRGTARCRGS